MNSYNLRLADLRLTTRAIIRINNLAIKAELYADKRFFVHKNIHELISLLHFGQSSKEPEVKEHFDILANFIDRDTIGFFRILGVDLKPDLVDVQKPKRNLKNIFQFR